MSIAFLFPDRGSQRPGMLHRLPDTAASATVLAEADLALRRLASRRGPGPGGGPGGDGGAEYADGIVGLDSPEALERSPVAGHLALLIAGVAGARALIDDEEVRPSFVLGHGAGGYAAAVLANVLTLDEALRAVRLRGELLLAAEGTGAAGGGTDYSADNAAGSALERDVAIRLAQHLATVKRRPQSVRYVGGTQGRSLFGDTNAVFDDLAWSVARPVRWPQAIAALAGEKVACCVEMPPGRALTERLASAGLPGMRAVSVEEQGIAEAGEQARAASGTARSVPGGDPEDAGPGADHGAAFPGPAFPGGPFPGGAGRGDPVTGGTEGAPAPHAHPVPNPSPNSAPPPDPDSGSGADGPSPDPWTGPAPGRPSGPPPGPPSPPGTGPGQSGLA